MMFKTKKTILIIVGISVAVLIAVGFNSRISRHVVVKTIIKNQEEIAQKAVDVVDIWMSQQKKILTATIASIPPQHIGENPQTFVPLQMAMKAAHFSDVYIGKEDGLLIDGAEWLPPPLYDPRVRPWYTHAVQEGEMSFTRPYIDLVTNEMVTALVQPLMADGTLIGVIGADTVLDTLEENVLKLKISAESFAFIVESGGTILIHPDRHYVMRENIFTIEPDLREIGLRLEGENPTSVRFTSASNQDTILSYQKIPDSNWFLCVIAPYDEAKKLARQDTMIFATELTLRALGILAMIVLLSAIGSGTVVFMLSRRYSSTVEKHKSELTGITEDLKWNITKRKEVEAYYKTLFDIANDGIIISRGYSLSECNAKTEEIFGMSKTQLLGKTFLDISPRYQPDGTLSADLLSDFFQYTQEEEQHIFRWSFVRSDGTEFPTSVSIKSFKLHEENLLLSSIRDISKRVDAEAQLLQAQKMAAVGEMLGIIAHQWRQPLNTLSTYISSLQAAQYNDMLTKSFIEKLVANADGQIKFMSKTIDDFRNFFKPSKTKEYFDIFDAVFNAVKLMEAQVRSADINLKIRNVAEESRLTVFGYRSEFVHVLVNIIANARDALQEKAMKAGGSYQRKIDLVINGDEEYVYVDIIDNGSGIPEHILPLIFNPYYTTKSSQSGTGVGLYMAKMVVEKEMSGQMTATNMKGATKFSIKLNRVNEESMG